MYIQIPREKSQELRLHIDNPMALEIFCDYFCKMFEKTYKPSPLIILCIGTDRSTGDSLGPLVGEKLKDICPYGKVFGNLIEPVHAVNLKKVLDSIFTAYDNPFIIAVDASLGRFENVGTIKIGPGAIKPGAAVNKNLPSVGNFHITGIVNVGGFMEHMVLQSTRLYTVMKMSDIISQGIAEGLEKIFF